MNFLRHRSSVTAQNDRLSYIHGPDQTYSPNYIHTFDPQKNLNDLFSSISVENVCVENLRVYLRVRPRLADEVQQDEDTQVDILDDRSVVLTAPMCSNTFRNSVRGITKLTHKFTFTHVYGPTTTQEELFQSSTHGLVSDFVNGQNCLMFTYGATNSGKTFTVQGTPEDAGLLPRTVQQIFTAVGESQYPKNDLKPKFSCSVIRLEEQDVVKEEEKRESIFKITSNLTNTFSQSSLSILKSSMCESSINSTEQLSDYSWVSHNTTQAGVSPVLESLNTTSATNTTTSRDSTSLGGNTVYAVFVSFAEIYNEYIFDLLEKIPTSKGKRRNPLMLGEDKNGTAYIKELNEVRVRTAEEALQLVRIGRQNLHFAATRLNQNSSRSHCIFTVKLVRLADAENPRAAIVSVLSLCDLAGAERAAKTSSTHDRLRESGNINTSLLTLSRCIEALRCNQMQKGNKKMPVPYRDSKLTRLFQSFLLGRGKAAMIVNISKMPLLFDETLQVLKFSAVAKQVAITQARESEVQVVQPRRREIRLSKMRQSLKDNGRLSVPWEKSRGSITFGESEDKENKGPEIVEDILEEDEETDDEEENERVEALLQLIGKLKEELMREHKEKQDLEERLRQELCKEFSQQLVEIQNSWNQRLRDQESRYEELTEYKVQALMKSVKKCNKRMRCEEDSDEEYVSSVFLFREQRKVEEQKQEIDELKANEEDLKAQLEALKESQKKTNELATQAQEEKSRLTFRLAQLTNSYDKVVYELKENKSFSISTNSNNNQTIEDLKNKLEKRSAQLEKQDQEIQELQAMLLEASEFYSREEKRCGNLEKMLESSQLTNTQHMMHINELESQLEETQNMLSQQAAQMEEREQDLEELRQQLSQVKKSNKEELSEKEQLLKKMEEDHMREKSKLLLELGVLKRNKPIESSGGHRSEEVEALERKVAQLEEEREAQGKAKEILKQKNTEKDQQIKTLEGKLSEKETDLEEEREEKETMICELKERIQESISARKKLEEEKEAEIVRLTRETETLSDEMGCLRANNEALMNQFEDVRNYLKEKEDAEVELQRNFTACRDELKELKQAHARLKEQEDSDAKLKDEFDRYKTEHEELQKAYASLKKQVDTQADLQENLDAYKVELEEMQRTQASLKEELSMKAELERKFAACKSELEEIQSTQDSLEEDRKSLENKLNEQTDMLNTLKAEREANIKEQNENTSKYSALCDKLKAELEELKDDKAEQDKALEEARQLQETKEELKTRLDKVEEEKCEIKTQVEMLEMDKKKMAERLYNLQEANQLKAQEAQAEIQAVQEEKGIITKEKLSLEGKVKAAEKLRQEQTTLVQEKQDVILALSSKIESLDAKLNKAEEEARDKKQFQQELETAKHTIIRLETKCELCQKEITALREARQAEVQESFNRTKDHEEFAKQKEAEISNLQQEVKKLLQQSLCSSRSSITEAPMKTETADPGGDVVSLREQLRLTVAHNTTLMQEVNTLRTKVARPSTPSEFSLLQLSASKSSQKERDGSVPVSEKEIFVTPVKKDGRGRRGKAATTYATRDSSRGDKKDSCDVSPVHSPLPVPTNSSGRPQRSTRRTMRYDSQEYELSYNDMDEDVWEPGHRGTTKGSRRPKTSKSKVSGVAKPILQDQENKSSMANKADIIPEPEPQPESKRGRKKSTRRTRVLYNSENFEEPFLCAPELVAEEPPEDSPLTTVRRQLRNKRK